MHLQRSDRSHHHHTVGDQPAIAALDVEELLHAAVGAEAGLGDQIAIGDHLEADHIGDDGGVAMRDVGEGTGMNDSCAVFQSLHQVGHDGLFHQHGHRPRHAQVFRCDRVPILVGADDDSAQPLS